MNALSRRLMIVGALVLGLMACNNKAATALGVVGEDMSMGNPKAKVQVTEYASLSCSHCAKFNNDVFPAFKKKYIDTGKIHYTFREFLTQPAEFAASGFVLARCLGPDKYFAALDAIFRHQAEMFATQDERGVLLRVAQSAGMSEVKFDACISNTDALNALNKRIDTYVSRDKIKYTPTFMINGQRLEGEQTLAQLDAAIQPLLK